MSEFSIDDLKATLGDLPGEPPPPNRGVAVRRRASVIRRRRSAAGAVAVALPVVGLSLFRGDPGRPEGDDVAAPFVTMSVEAPTATPTRAPVTTPPAARRSVAPATPTAIATATAPAPKPVAVTSPTPTAAKSAQSQPTIGTSKVPVPVPSKTKAAPPPAKPDPIVQRPGPGLRVRLAASDKTVKVGEKVDFTVVWSDTDGIYVGYEMSYGDIGASKFSRVRCTGDVQPSGGTVTLSHAWQHAGTYHVDYAVRTCNGAGKYEEVASSVVVTVVSPQPVATPTPTVTATPTPKPTPTPTTAPSDTSTADAAEPAASVGAPAA